MFILVFSDERSYSHLPDDTRMISLPGQECALFHTVSLDNFCEIYVLPMGEPGANPAILYSDLSVPTLQLVL